MVTVPLSLHLSHFFCCIIKINIYPIYCFGHSSSQSVSEWNSFPPLKYIVYKCYSCFRPGMGHFFSLSHLYTLVALFLLYHQKIFILYIVLVTVRLSLFRNEILFLLWNTLSTNVTVVSDQGWAIFFHRHTCLHLSHFFCCIIKINIYPIYCFGHSSSQSVSKWNSFPPLKYIVYKCYSWIRPGMGHFFSSSHLSTLVALFLLYNQKIFIPYIVWSQFVSSVSEWNSFPPLKYIVYKCYSCFRPGMGHFFFIITLVYTCHTFFAVSSKLIFIPYIVLVTVRLSLFRNEILFLL